jgi:CheY-like chemotaxis protein
MVMLSHMPDVNAIGAGSVAEAKLVIAHHTPQLVLLDLELPDGTGLDVMNFLTQRELQVGLVIISAHLGTFRSKLRPNDRLHLLTELRAHPLPGVVNRRRAPARLAVVGRIQDAHETAKRQ